MKWWMLLFCLLSAPLSAQRWMHGVLLGGGVGFTHNLEVNPACDEYGREGFIYDDTSITPSILAIVSASFFRRTSAFSSIRMSRSATINWVCIAIIIPNLSRR